MTDKTGVTPPEREEIARILQRVKEALDNIFKTGHGEVTLHIADKRCVDFNYQAKWHLKEKDN